VKDESRKEKEDYVVYLMEETQAPKNLLES
jgi:hypothetical protein